MQATGARVFHEETLSAGSGGAPLVRIWRRRHGFPRSGAFAGGPVEMESKEAIVRYAEQLTSLTHGRRRRRVMGAN